MLYQMGWVFSDCVSDGRRTLLSVVLRQHTVLFFSAPMVECEQHRSKFSCSLPLLLPSEPTNLPSVLIGIPLLEIQIG